MQNTIDINKVRNWSTSFGRSQVSDVLPYPVIVVNETQLKGYKIGVSKDAAVPPELGGQLTFTLSGRGRLFVGNKKYDLLPGTAFLYRHCDTSVSYHFAEDSEKPWNFIWIEFGGLASEKIISIFNNEHGYFFTLREDTILPKQLLYYKKFSQNIILQSSLEGAKIVIDLLLILKNDVINAEARRSVFRLSAEVEREITMAYDGELPTSSLARKLGVSREHLSRVFRAETGLSIKDFRNKHRLEEAWTLLLHTNLSCKEVAHRCHFGSYSSFHRAFVKQFGFSPQKIRNKQN